MSLELQKPWARASNTTRRFCGFVTVANPSPTPDRLVSASSPIARKVAICAIKIVNSGTRMKVLPEGLKIPPDTTMPMRPRGYHLYFLGANPPPKPGDTVPVTLIFEKAGEKKLMLKVEAPGPVGKETLKDGVEA